MKNVITRLITGILYIAVIVCALLAGGWWTWGLTMLLAMLGLNEFIRITNKNFVSNTTRLFDLLGAVCLITAFAPTQMLERPASWICLALYFLYFIIRFIAQLYVQDGNPLEHLAHSVMGQVYVVWPLAMLELLYTVFGAEIALGMFILIWLSDTGAFCVGSLVGRHKLFERISPKKSWEGFFGGLAFCLLAGGLFPCLFPNFFGNFNIWVMLGMGATVAVAATWGDLIESLIKRSLGVKDSGNLLPGHGGILDRIDSLLLVVPTLLLYLSLATMCTPGL